MLKDSKRYGAAEKNSETWSYVMSTPDALALANHIGRPRYICLHALLTQIDGVIDVPSWLDHVPTVAYVIDPEDAPEDIHDQVAAKIDELISAARRSTT